MAPGLLARLQAAEVGRGPPLRRLGEYASLCPRGFAALNVAHSRSPAALLELDSLSASRDAARARTALLTLSTACHFTSDGNAREQPDALAAQRGVVETGAWLTLVALLLPDWDAAGAAGPAAAHALVEVRAEAAAILRELGFGVASFGETLAACPPLPARLLELCGDPELFSTASALLEEVVTAARRTPRVSALPRFAETVRGLSAPHLAVFCRVLALLVYENEEPPEPQQSAGPPLLRNERDAPRFADDNHAALLAIPELLPRLVRLLRMPAGAPLGHAALSSRVQQLLAVLPPTAQAVIPQLLGLVLSRSGGADTSWDLDEADGASAAAPVADAVLAAAVAGDDGGAGAAAAAAALSSWALPPGGHQVEVLFMMCALLGGPAKAAAQDALAAAGLVPALEKLFNAVDWDGGAEDDVAQQPDGAQHAGLHGPGCTCNPANALKLQFLRVVHAFLERDADNRRNKRLLLSPDDLAAFYADEGAAAASAAATACGAAAPATAQPQQPPATQPSVLSAMAAARRRLTLCIARAAVRTPPPPPPLAPPAPPSTPSASELPAAPAGTGLMGKLLRRLVAEPPDSPHRFWLASCAEGFLRGSRPADQRFAASAGLLPHLLDDILAEGPKPSGALQIACDLLGELLKHNRALFAELDAELAATPGRLARLTAVLMAHLVDSNVLLRAVALSVESFAAADAAAAAAAEGGSAACAELCASGSEGDTCCAEEEDDDDGEHFASAWPQLAPPAGVVAARAGAGALGAWLCAEWLNVLEALMSAVAAHEVDQESVCVINSALCLLIHAQRQGRLAAVLAALRKRQRPGGDPRPSACAGFAALLACWRRHYTGRARDCASLEFSTGIPFGEWVRCVDALCGPPSSPLALLHA